MPGVFVESRKVPGHGHLSCALRFRQRQHGFDVHFDCSFYDQVGNGRQLMAQRNEALSLQLLEEQRQIVR